MTSIIIVTSISFVLSVFIIIVSVVFKSNRGVFQKKLLDALPGYNCGACGFASCEGMSKKLLEKKEYIEKCKPITKEQKDNIKKIMK